MMQFYDSEDNLLCKDREVAYFDAYFGMVRRATVTGFTKSRVTIEFKNSLGDSVFRDTRSDRLLIID